MEVSEYLSVHYSLTNVHYINAHEYVFQDKIAIAHPSEAIIIDILKALHRRKGCADTNLHLVYTLATGNAFDKFKKNKIEALSQWKTRIEDGEKRGPGRPRKQVYSRTQVEILDLHWVILIFKPE